LTAKLTEQIVDASAAGTRFPIFSGKHVLIRPAAFNSTVRWLLCRMQAQRTELLSQLPEHGWRVASIEEDLEWWADEMWLLESVWSPVGRRAYVTFLVDPQFDGNRKMGEAVWAVMTSPAKPMSQFQVAGEFTLSLGPGWRDRLPAFFDHLSSLRG
jgi:hypothetical protein